jgi:hypothetical protein
MTLAIGFSMLAWRGVRLFTARRILELAFVAKFLTAFETSHRLGEFALRVPGKR